MPPPGAASAFPGCGTAFSWFARSSKQPKVLLADEPTGNLDEGMRDEIMDVLERLWKEHGLTFIMVTHDSAIARKAPRVATIRKGKITVRENAGA